MKKQATKIEGQVFTPKTIVNNMLDFIGYQGDAVLKKYVMENSCGNGSFLVEIVKRYITEFFRTSTNTQQLKHELETYISGIEKDSSHHGECIDNLNKLISDLNISIDWNIVCGDTLILYESYINKYDYLIGNPPYIKVHNLNDSYINAKTFKFAESSMTDIYLVFFEIGLKMLKHKGKMCLITPSSCLKSKAGANFRQYVLGSKSLSKIVDLAHFIPFENITTYTMISLFEKDTPHPKVEYYGYDFINGQPDKIRNLSYDELEIDGKICLGSTYETKLLKAVNDNFYSQRIGLIKVKNGFATLADKVFIGDFDFDEHTIKVLKASTGAWYKAIYPYDETGNPIEFNKLSSKVKKYLINNEELLKKRAIEKSKDWYLFGRSQGLRDVHRSKIAINSLIKSVESIKLVELPMGTGAYGGLYILSDFAYEDIKKAILSDEFFAYIKALKNYKSGGYYTFSSMDLEKYLEFKLNKQNSNKERPEFALVGFS